jgi:putative endonuclease
MTYYTDMRKFSYYVYIMGSKSNVLYVGMTNNLQERVYQHKNKLVKGFTEKYNVDRLLFYQEFEDVNDAIEMEKKVKGWVRAKKMELIKTINPEFRDLTEGGLN